MVRLCAWVSSPVHLPAVSDSDYNHDANLVLDLVNYTIISDPQAVAPFLPLQLFYTPWSGLTGESVNLGSNPLLEALASFENSRLAEETNSIR